MKNEILNYVGAGACWILTAIQVDEVLKYINLGLSIIITLFSLAMTFYSFYSKIKAKGKIEKADMEEAKNDIEKIKEEIEDYLKNNCKGESENDD
ncbi:MAG TPA: hypothetical protein DD377_00730 [Firmicutes bacterium]|nr:hypothetical protein [Bacillota bacterium]